MLRAPFDQTTTEGTAWSSTMEEPSPPRSLSSQPLALPAPQCQDAHAPALSSRTITRKLKIIIIIATLNHCPFEQPTTVTHENEGADEADGLPLQFSNPAHGDLRDTSFGRWHSVLFVQPQAVVTRQRSMPASSIFRKAHNGEMTLSRATSQQPHCHLPQNRCKAKKTKKKPTCAFFFVSRKLYQSLQT